MSAEAQKKGVTGVPFAVIEGKWAVSGCQKPECYYKVRLHPFLLVSRGAALMTPSRCRYSRSSRRPSPSRPSRDRPSPLQSPRRRESRTPRRSLDVESLLDGRRETGDIRKRCTMYVVQP